MVDLQDLEAQLAPLSHSAEAIELIRTACKSLANTRERIALWNARDAIVREPIQPEYVKELGFNHPDDAFVSPSRRYRPNGFPILFGEAPCVEREGITGSDATGLVLCLNRFTNNILSKMNGLGCFLVFPVLNCNR